MFKKRYFTSKNEIYRYFLLISVYIKVRIDLAICYPTPFHVALPLQKFPWLTSNCFMPIQLPKVPMQRNLAVNNKSCA